MKLLSIKITVTMIVFFEKRFPIVDGFDPYVAFGNMGRYFRNFFHGIKDVSVGVGRHTSYGWYIAETAFKNADVSWERKAAEHFYYSEYKRRDRRYRRRLRKKEAKNEVSKKKDGGYSIFHPWESAKTYHKRKKLKEQLNKIDEKLERSRQKMQYEFYCTDHLQSRRRRLCEWALLNSRVEDYIWDTTSTAQPTCEYRRVRLHSRFFETEGTFLRCPYQKKTTNAWEPLMVYIKAVKNPAEFRLILYWLVEDVPNIEPEPPHNQQPAVSGNPLHAPTHGLYPKVEEYAMTGVPPYYWPNGQPPHTGNANTNAQQPSTDFQWEQPSTSTSGANPYVFLQPVPTNNGNVARPATVPLPQYTSADIRRMTPMTHVHQPAQEFAAMNSKPPLRVVYMLLNKRFTKNPAESLFL